MKKFLSLCLCLLLLIGMLPTAHAADGISVTINGSTVTFDQPPVIIDGRTLVPIRAVCEALGADVYWYEDYEVVFIVKNDTKLLLSQYDDIMAVLRIESIDELLPMIEENLYFEDAIQEIVLDVPPQIINGRTLLPIRAVCETLGATVNWDYDTQTVLITCPQEIIDNKNRDTDFFDSFVSFITEGNEVLFALLREPYLKNDYTITMKVRGSFINESAKEIFAHAVQSKLSSQGISSDSLTIFSNKILFFFGTDGAFDQEALVADLRAKPKLHFKDADGNILLDETDVVKAEVNYDGNEPTIALTFTEAGRTKFAQATEHVAARPAGENYIGIYVDDLCISMPYVAERIDSAECIISGGFDYALASELAAALNPQNFPDDVSFEFEIQENK